MPSLSRIPSALFAYSQPHPTCAAIEPVCYALLGRMSFPSGLSRAESARFYNVGNGFGIVVEKVAEASGILAP